MKVLQVSCEGLGNGGVQAVIMNICRNLPEIQFDILLFTNERRYYDDEFELLGGKIFRIPKYEESNKLRTKLDYYIRFFRIFKGTYRVVKNNGPYDAIHCHNDLESGICNLAAYFAGIKIRISHAHTSSNKFPKKSIIAYTYRKILQKLMVITSNLNISCTKEAFISIFSEKYLSNLNAFIIPNPIDLEGFIRKRRCVGNTTELNIVHVGRYDKNKNQLFIIDLLPYIITDIPNVKLKLVGTGYEYRNKLLSRIKELNLESFVDLLPSNSDVKEVLDIASLFIFPSISEGFGIVLLEAQAMEVPCLVSDTVPKEVDCGLCKFLSISDKEAVWSHEAIDIIKGNHNMKLNKEKLGNFDVKKYAQFIDTLYRGQDYEGRDAYFSQCK